MTIEVEHKYRVTDPAALEQQLTALGGVISPPQLQVDTYFAHPSRDFAATDEALRIRCVGPRNYVTYKGPKLDPHTKTRCEIELPIAPEQSGAADCAELLMALGFRRVREVRKQRRSVAIPWQGDEVTVALDDVAGIGHFVELELAVEESAVPAAQACLASLSTHLRLSNSERRSYLELLLLSDS